MTNKDIVGIVNKTLCEEFELSPEEMRPEASFRDDLGLDSLDAVDMVIVLEEAFGMKIGKDPKINEIQSLADLYAFIGAKKDVLEQ